ncbi:MAG TPA: DUF2399 domain-containing protein [Polyangiaceae bacterium]
MSALQAELEAMVQATPGLGAVLAEILDRVEQRQGRLPARITLRAPNAVSEALARIFTPRAVRPARAKGPDTVRLEFATIAQDRALERALVEALYSAMGRAPRDRLTEDRERRTALERGLLSLECVARGPASLSFLRAQRLALGQGESALVVRAAASDVATALRLVSDVVHCVDALAELKETMRAQTFAARFLGNSKALRPGGELHRWVGEALVSHDPRTVSLLDELGAFPSIAAYRASALEAHGVLFDEAAASVLCFGPIVYRKQGSTFDHVARHAQLGESSRIVVQQLRDATLDPPAVERVTIFENLAPYLDYVDARVGRGLTPEIVVCSAGQANLAVVGLLRRLAAHGLSARYLGDLDRSGVLILRSLARRTGLRLTPRFMDVDTHRHFVSRGLALSDDEHGRLTALLRVEDTTLEGHGLLREIALTRRWIEQESFSDDVLDELLER